MSHIKLICCTVFLKIEAIFKKLMASPVKTFSTLKNVLKAVFVDMKSIFETKPIILDALYENEILNTVKTRKFLSFANLLLLF